MKVSLPILLLCVVLVFSCKKPREGNYIATFKDSVSGVSRKYKCSIDKNKTRIIFGDIEGETIKSITGELFIDKGDVNGYFNYINPWLSSGSYYKENYILKGKSKRKSISGTYWLSIDSKDLSNNVSYTTSSGDFEILYSP